MRMLFPLGLLLAMAPATAAETAARPWEVFEVELTAAAGTTALPENSPPEARVVFRSGSNAIAVAAFWDGGRTWRARFAPPAAGEWRYRSESADPSLDGKSGAFRCQAWSEEEKRANPARRGFVLPRPAALLRVRRWHPVPVDRRHVVELDQAGHSVQQFPEAGRRPRSQGLHGRPGFLFAQADCLTEPRLPTSSRSAEWKP